MTLKLKSTTKAVTVEYIDGRHTSTWSLDASLADDELVDELRRIVQFYDAQTGCEPLPQRIPGMALGMAQEAHPPMMHVAGNRPSVGNGWAAMATPEIPERLQGEVELIPPEEQT